ncbi:MAG: hydroxyethylthiazole kinase [Gemmatimonadaceae bacterium]|nr:hydroxyethylthiazole kinase [Gemmatimonadaceae bacterium]
MFDASRVLATRSALRAQAPLVHNITNFVVMNGSANALLAVGAAPAMVHALDEVEEFVGLASALVCNIGTLDAGWVEAMHRAAARAGTRGIPWVLDPVGAGATSYRTLTARALLAHRPAVLRGNASEILAVAGRTATTRGVDSTATADAAADAARLLARAHDCVVVATGAVDVATDGTRTVRVANGHVALTRVTGTGCVLSAITAACCAVEPDALAAAVAALVLVGVAGEVAAMHTTAPGSFAVAWLDQLATLDDTTLAARTRLH